MTELLKQKLFVPMPTEEEVVSLFAGVRGYLDKIATKEIPRFEQLWLEYVRGSKPEILATIKKEAQITPETDTMMKAAMDEFTSMNEFAA